jgi:signal transduction histidine kinase
MGGLKQSDNPVVAFLVRKRHLLLFSIIAFLVIVEIIEQLLAASFGQKTHILYDGLIFLIIIPVGVWLLLRQLKKLDVERERAQASSDQLTDFSQRLGDARSWEELVQQIVAYPHWIAPQAEITLFILNPGNQNIKPEITCLRDGKMVLKPDININPDTLPVGSLPQLLIQNDSAIPSTPAARLDAFRQRRAHGAAPAPTHVRYDLPIIYNNEQIGVIKLDFLPGAAPTAGQIRALKAAAPVMALALEGALLQKVAADQAAASEIQRQEIAQTLHDTLAQNIGYLRLKLDQLTGENAIREIGAVLQELERMRTIADEAYQQVRNTLDELNPTQAENLVSTVIMQAQTIGQRAGFNLRTSKIGAPHTLPTPTCSQILFIIREALYNVEKHARANQVHLQFLWLECELIIKVTDNGVGFNPRAVPAEGHYGLWIRQQRAQEIGGTIKITPASDSSGAPDSDESTEAEFSTGTEVTLWVPFPPAKKPAEKHPASQPPQPETLTGAASQPVENPARPKPQAAP